MFNQNSINSQDQFLHSFVEARIKNINTAMIVKVLQINAETKRINVQPLISQIDYLGNQINHATIHDIPYMRLQGGDFGIICDPQVGDIGIVVFCSRDMSRVLETKTLSKPPSLRSYALSDALYIGSLLLDEPTTFIKIEKDNVTIEAKNVTIQSQNVTINGETTISEDAKINGISFKSHVHGNGNQGQDTTAPKE